jgi:hypothetical protein
MPPGGKLSDEQIGKLELWVRSGASMPTDEQTAKVQRSIDIQAGRVHWSFVPTQPLAIESVRLQRLRGESELINNRIDAAILNKLDELELTPAPQADRRALVRRLKLDLLGLLPSEEEVSGFVQDPSPDAYLRLVDEYLASPQYGERWARYWLDLVRYCDTMEEWTETIGPSYPYRDWVVEALNKDLPYDQFIHLQLAADQMPGALASDRAALGFLGLSPSYWKELQLPVELIKSIVSDEVEERVHTVSSTFLGLNLACARCHDHKYDPLTHSDYYAIAGVLANTKSTDVALTQGVDAAEVVQARKTVKTLTAELEKITKSDKDEDKVKAEDIRQKIDQSKAVVGYDALLTPGVKDARLTVLPADGVHGSKIVYEQELKDLSIEIRGNPNKLGASVPRRFVSVLTDPTSAPQAWNSGSGRYDLARSITSQSRDLVARVMVNRIWQGHFGTGLVDTPSDFGRTGSRPSHSGLLDWLAREFIANGGSAKHLHRLIVLSSTYRQSSSHRKEAAALDADARLLWRYPARRLDSEPIRDAMLTVSGELNRQRGGRGFDLFDQRGGLSGFKPVESF